MMLRFFFCLSLLILLPPALTAHAQVKSPTTPIPVPFWPGESATRSADADAAQQANEGLNQPIEMTFGEGATKPFDESISIWRFGLSMTAEGAAQGIVATTPLPIECPEQDVEEIERTLGDGVRGVKLKTLRPLARQMVFTIPALRSGQGGDTAITFKITKRAITAPQDTNQFVFARNPRGRLKKDFLGPSPFIESDDKRIVEIARQLASDHKDKSAWQQVEAIYTWVRTKVEYKFDTEIHSCLDALDSGTGDCEELSSLFIAICRARDIPARAVWIPGHTYPEFYLEDGEGDGHWFPCQAAGTYQFGSMNERRPILQKGDRYKISGQRKLLRYAQPTLKCRNVEGSMDIEQIAEELQSPDANGRTAVEE